MNSFTRAREQLKRLSKDKTSRLSWYYRMGKLALQVQPKSGDRGWGNHVLGRLAQGVYSATFLYGVRDFASTYRPDELASLARLSWSHVKRLCSIHTLPTRRKLQRKCQTQKWSVKRLQKEIQAELGPRSNFSKHVPTFVQACNRLMRECRASLKTLMGRKSLLKTTSDEKLAEAVPDLSAALKEVQRLKRSTLKAEDHLVRVRTRAVQATDARRVKS